MVVYAILTVYISSIEVVTLTSLQVVAEKFPVNLVFDIGHGTDGSKVNQN